MTAPDGLYEYATLEKCREARADREDRRLLSVIFSALLVVCLVVISVHVLDAVGRGNARRDRIAACKTIEVPAQRASCIKGA